MSKLWKSSSDDFVHLLESSEFHDTEILAGKEPDTKIFKAHSLILKTRSPYFRTAFSSNWVKTENNIITLQKPNISADVFDILIKFIYSGFINLPEYDTRTNIAVLIAADELCLNDLCVHTEEFLLKNDQCSLKCEFILVQKTVYQLTQFHGLSHFYERSIREDPSLILRANDFTSIPQDALLDFLTEFNQSLNPIEIWDKLIKWAIAQTNKLPSDTKEWKSNEITTYGKIVNPFIEYINFEKINLSNFCQSIKPFKDIFDKDIYVQMLEHYSFNEDTHSNFKLDIDSRIISSGHAFLLCNLIKMAKQDDRNRSYEFHLLLSGSRGGKDGFTTEKFHNNCDEKGPTITIANVKNTNEIVGGFNPLDWNSKTEGKTDQSFIFSLDKNKLSNFIFSKVVDENHAVHKMRGPDFGEGKSDLRLLLENDNKKGQCHKISYEKLIRQVEGVFEIDDYEVFQVKTFEDIEVEVESEAEAEAEPEIEIEEYNEWEVPEEHYAYDENRLYDY